MDHKKKRSSHVSGRAFTPEFEAEAVRRCIVGDRRIVQMVDDLGLTNCPDFYCCNQRASPLAREMQKKLRPRASRRTAREIRIHCSEDGLPTVPMRCLLGACSCRSPSQLRAKTAERQHRSHPLRDPRVICPSQRCGAYALRTALQTSSAPRTPGALAVFAFAQKHLLRAVSVRGFGARSVVRDGTQPNRTGAFTDPGF